jgi:hypothetical protein
MVFIQPAISAAFSDASNYRSTSVGDGGAVCARIEPPKRVAASIRELVIPRGIRPPSCDAEGHFIGREMRCPTTPEFCPEPIAKGGLCGNVGPCRAGKAPAPESLRSEGAIVLPIGHREQ